MTWQEHTNNPLWPILADTVHTIIMYPHHKAYVRDVLLNEKPDITAQELALRLNMSLGESLVILSELQKPAKPPEQQKP